jgi:hypothetical protein
LSLRSALSLLFVLLVLSVQVLRLLLSWVAEALALADAPPPDWVVEVDVVGVVWANAAPPKPKASAMAEASMVLRMESSWMDGEGRETEFRLASRSRAGLSAKSVPHLNKT